MGQNFYPFYDPKDDEFFIVQCFDYELDEYKGFPLSRYSLDISEEDCISTVKSKMDKLPPKALTAFKVFIEDAEEIYRGCLDNY